MNFRHWTRPAVGLSVLIHLVGLAWFFIQPSAGWTIVLILVGNHLILTSLGLIPRSRALGPNMSRLPATEHSQGKVVLTFDDGPDPEFTPQVLDILEAHGARGTFFVIGSNVDQHPALCAEIVARGHQVENHSYGHSLLFATSSVRGYREDISRAQNSIKRATGRRPQYFRAPFGFRSPLLAPALDALGLQFISWTRRGFDTREPNPARVFDRLIQGLKAGDILLLHDRGSALTEEGRPVCLVVLPRLLEAIKVRGLEAVRLSDAISPGFQAEC